MRPVSSLTYQVRHAMCAAILGVILFAVANKMTSIPGARADGWIPPAPTPVCDCPLGQVCCQVWNEEKVVYRVFLPAMEGGAR